MPIKKLRSADLALEEAKDLWQGYVDQKPLRLEIIKDAGQHAIVVFTHLDPSPPFAEMERRLRQVVNDGRSALDNFVTELASQRTDDKDELRKVAFPAALKRRGWKSSNWDRRLRCLPNDVLDRIKHVQPYNQNGEGCPTHPLAILHGLWNADKHSKSFAPAVGIGFSSENVLLSEMQIKAPACHWGDLIKHFEDVDNNIDIDVGPVGEGQRLMVFRLPGRIDLDEVGISFRSLPFTLGIIGRGADITDSAFAVLKNSLRYARESVRYVAGVTDAAPNPFPSGIVGFAR